MRLGGVAALSAGLLAAVLASGCAASPAASAGPAAAARPSVTVCTAQAGQAIEQRITLVRMPAGCRGLSRAQANFALGRAIYQVAGAGQRKTVWRRQAAVAGARLARLIASLPPSRPARPGPYQPPAPAPRPSADLGLVTLAAWVLTIASGGYMLGTWLVRGGLARHRAGGEGLAPGVLFLHFGLAVLGLAGWTGYLATGWLALAWLAACSLMPVTGLGISVVTLWVPYPSGATAATGMLTPPAADRLTARVSDAVLTRALTDEKLAGQLVEQVVAQLPAGPPPPTRRPWTNLATLLPAAHGVAAIATMLLTLMAAVIAS